MKKYDVAALGEILIDFTYHCVSENGNVLFEQNPGGAPANLLAAVQKLGGKTAFIGKAGKDMHGEFLKKILENVGIATQGLVLDENYFTTLAFVNLTPDGERSFSFSRKPGADTQICKGEVDYSLIKNSKIFHIGSLSLTDEPAKSATLFALNYAKENDIIVSYDPNYRAMLWENEEAAVKEMRSVLDLVDIIKISEEEIHLLTDESTPEEAAKVLLNKGIACVIVTLGDKGAYVATKEGAVLSPCLKSKVVDTTGAGDSFMGGFLYQMSRDNIRPQDLDIDHIKAYAEFANRAASVCVGRRGAIQAMPSLEEVSS